MNVRILDESEQDLVDGFRFYEMQDEGLGDYFLDSLFADIDCRQDPVAFNGTPNITLNRFGEGGGWWQIRGDYRDVESIAAKSALTGPVRYAGVKIVQFGSVLRHIAELPPPPRPLPGCRPV